MSTAAGFTLYLLDKAAHQHESIARKHIYLRRVTRYLYDAHGSKFAIFMIVIAPRSQALRHIG